MSDTYQEFFTQVLQGLDAPVTEASLDAFYAISTFEGLNGRYNPVNSVVPHGDSTKFNSVGVQDYKTFANGVAGTVALYKGEPWTHVVAALKGSDSTQMILEAVAAVYDGWDHGVTWKSFPAKPGLGAKVMESDTDQKPPVQPGPPMPDDREYTVVRNDSLWVIAEKEYGAKANQPPHPRWQDIATANDLHPPYKIIPGQKLRIPK